MSSAGGTVRDQCGSDRVTEGMMVAEIFRRIMGTGSGEPSCVKLYRCLQGNGLLCN